MDAKRRYLGRYEAPESRAKYHRMIAEWLGSGGQPPDKPADITIIELAARYWRVVEDKYPAKTGKGAPRGQAWLYKASLDALAELYGDLAVLGFGPLKFQAVRNAFVRRGVSRGTANKMTACIKRAISWGVSQELVPPSVYHGLQAVKGLRRGETTAPDHPPVKPVPMEHITAVQPHVSRQVWALIQLQLRTAARAGELVTMRAVDIDMGGRIWVYVPTEHKTAHHSHKRVVYIGPVGQGIVRPFLTGRPVDAFLFSPREAEAERREKMHEERATPATCGNTIGSNRKPSPECEPGDHYTVASYRRAIARACEAANVSAWHPHALRHNAGTMLEREFGLATAALILGHSSPSVTSIYAEANHAKAVEVIAKIG
jgi:integrase